MRVVGSILELFRKAKTAVAEPTGQFILSPEFKNAVLRGEAQEFFVQDGDETYALWDSIRVSTSGSSVIFEFYMQKLCIARMHAPADMARGDVVIIRDLMGMCDIAFH